MTTPRDKSIRVLDAKHAHGRRPRSASRASPRASPSTTSAGSSTPTSRTRTGRWPSTSRRDKTVATWAPDCGEDGPKGLALDEAKGFLFVACADRAKVLDAGHDGEDPVGMIDTGDGVDNIDYVDGAPHALRRRGARGQADRRAPSTTRASSPSSPRCRPRAARATASSPGRASSILRIHRRRRSSRRSPGSEAGSSARARVPLVVDDEATLAALLVGVKEELVGLLGRHRSHLVVRRDPIGVVAVAHLDDAVGVER